ncbi:MAG: hypothetical protein NVSMB59_20400 [Vulcanimicrobiaceae bacterium]
MKARTKSLTSLIVCREAPYPPYGGSPLRMWQHVNTLATLGPVHVFSIGKPTPGVTTMPVASSWQHFDPNDFPHERSLPIVSRALSVLRPRQFPTPNRRADGRLNRSLRDTLRRVVPDVVILSHWENAFPSALGRFPHVIVDSHNIEWQIRADGAFVVSKKLSRGAKIWSFKRRERRLYERADRLWVTSENDRLAVRAFAPRATSATVIPNAIDTASYASVGRSIAPPPGVVPGVPTLILVGDFGYRPNEEAALTLLSDIFPHVVARFPEARVLLVGRGPTRALLDAASNDVRVTVTGTVSDVRPYLAAADVAVIPLTIGGGTRIKILEAFAARLPVISTRKGAEGLQVTHDREIVIADDCDTIVRDVIRIVRDAEVRDRLTDAAFRFVSDRYSWDAVTQLMPAALCGDDRGR